MLTDNEEKDADYVKEYKQTLKSFAEFAAERPERIDSLREALMASAAVMMSNRPEAVEQFRQLTEEMSSFLGACQSGEVDPDAFIQSLNEEASGEPKRSGGNRRTGSCCD